MANDSSSARSRRDFFKRAASMTAGASLVSTLQAAVQRAAAIDPSEGSTYQDAEHIVILMQENRSFDHAFGTLKGVRGFNDPRAVTLPDGKPVWLQTNPAGETYAPFRLDIRNTKSTWLGSLPHSWRDQTDARNHGNHDQWLTAKASGRSECAGMPLTLGYYDRQDIPFYYALADAFTICDQHFCSSLTGTTPNRLYLWSGAIRSTNDAAAVANVRNSDVDYDANVGWKTFPERLEDAGVSWRIYQNEISVPSGLSGEEDAWLANFTDNPIEWFAQYNVGFSQIFQQYAASLAASWPKELAKLDQQLATAQAGSPEHAKLTRQKAGGQRHFDMVSGLCAKCTPAAFAKLSQRERNLHQKAFSTNAGDPDYRRLTTLRYDDHGTPREMAMPKGDVLHQFRQDVNSGTLPTVSWLVAPENFSDHPGAPWYGAWYLAEVLNILTHKPEVWKKTIFLLTYDENDGYFDHVPPFVAPDPSRPETGRTSPGIDAGQEFWSLERDREKRSPAEARGGPVGLGYRVPLLIASPWSRGGYVCSQVFDHTSVLQLLESITSRRAGKPIREENISAWRRAVCGDLSSTFQPFHPNSSSQLQFPSKESVLTGIHEAQFKKLPSGYHKVSEQDAREFSADRFKVAWMPQQEAGIRPSLALPYQLYADGHVSPDGQSFELQLEASNKVFGKAAAGSGFHVYTPGTFRNDPTLRTRAYAVGSGQRLADLWQLNGFKDGEYHLCVCGPNGFYREFTGTKDDPAVTVRCEYAAAKGRSNALNGDVEVRFSNGSTSKSVTFEVSDEAFGTPSRQLKLAPGKSGKVVLPLQKSFHWYDFSVRIAEYKQFSRRYAGRVETGKAGFSDPVMGRVKV